MRGIDLIDDPGSPRGLATFLVLLSISGPGTPQFFVNAPVMSANILSRSNLMSPLQRVALQQMRASFLPEMLSWIDAALHGSVSMRATGEFGCPPVPPQQGPLAGTNAYPAHLLRTLQ